MQSVKSGNPILSILKGALAAYIVTMLVMVGYAALLTHTSASDIHTAAIARSVTGVCALLGGFISAVGCKRHGLISGILSGALYILIMLTMTILVTKDSLGTGALISTLISVTGGGIGGILGIQLLHKS